MDVISDIILMPFYIPWIALGSCGAARLIHARFILTSRGMAAMLDKYNCYVVLASL